MTGYYDANGQRVAKGIISSWSCDPTANGFSFTSNCVLGPSGEQLTELDLDSNGTMTWQHTNVFASRSAHGDLTNAGLHFHLNDWLGTRRAQTDYMRRPRTDLLKSALGIASFAPAPRSTPRNTTSPAKKETQNQATRLLRGQILRFEYGPIPLPRPKRADLRRHHQPSESQSLQLCLEQPTEEYRSNGALLLLYGGQGDTVENDSDASDYDFTSTGTGECNSEIGGQWIDNPSSTVHP